MVPFWFTLSALCFTGAAVLLYVDIGRRRGLGRRRKSWARAHGFDYEQESAEIIDRWKRGESEAMTAQQVAGYELFRGRAGCT